MINPFDDSNEITLTSGFYFDKKRGLICFYYEEKNEMNTSVSIYNRFLAYQTSIYTMFKSLQEKDKNMTEPADLVALTSSLLKNKENLVADFKWLSSKYKIENSFIEFLTEKEEYSILLLFKTYITHKHNE